MPGGYRARSHATRSAHPSTVAARASVARAREARAGTASPPHATRGARLRPAVAGAVVRSRSMPPPRFVDGATIRARTRSGSARLSEFGSRSLRVLTNSAGHTSRWQGAEGWSVSSRRTRRARRRPSTIDGAPDRGLAQPIASMASTVEPEHVPIAVEPCRLAGLPVYAASLPASMVLSRPDEPVAATLAPVADHVIVPLAW